MSPAPTASSAARTTSRVALGTFLVAGAAFVVLAAVAVPWGAADAVLAGHPRTVPAESVLTAAQVERGEAYARTARLLSWSALAVSLAVALGLGLTPLGARLVRRLRGPWWLVVVQAVAVLAVVGRLVTLPFALGLRQQRLDAGLTRQGIGGYAYDLAVGLGTEVVATSLALLVLIGLARRLPRAWPAVAAGVVAVLVLLGSFVYPLLVEPLTNRFTPLPDGPLRSQVLALADAEHVRVDDVLVADASRRTTTLNAYVSGFGSTRRVVLYDTAVADLPRDELLSVVAHELTHARHDDVLVGSALGALGAAASVGLLGLVLASGRLRRRAGLEGAEPDRSDRPDRPDRPGGLADPAVVPLVLALLAVGTLLAAPVQNTISRAVETRADLGALEATRDPAALEGLQRALEVRSVGDPTPPAWSQLWFGSHPTVLQRVALARAWAAEHPSD